jgi:2,4-dienoyl-CoA reductase-like NADH-dependent reductase (Old Yellow Enzyme family)
VSLLFSPLRLNRVTMPNRVWLPAMVTWLSNEAGEVTEDVRRRYVRYAKGEPGAIVMEAMGVRDVASGPLMRISHERYVPALRSLVAEVHQTADVLVLPQLIDFLKIARRDPARSLARLEARYPGCSGWSEAELQARLTPREWRDHAWGYRQQIEDLTEPEILALPGQFAAAARRARDAGFDGVELHYAHAYTMASFLSPTNARTDAFGGSLENRARLPLMVIRAVREAVGADYCVGLRLLGAEDIPGGSTVADAAWFSVQFAAAGVDFVSVSRGGRFEDAKRPKVGEAAYPYTGPSGIACMPTRDFPDGYNLPLPTTIRAAIRAAGHTTPVVGGGKVNDPALAEAALQDGRVDAVAMARGLLADPDWAKKVREGRPFHACKYTNVCEALDRHHKAVRCQLWMKHPEGGLHAPEEW